VNKARLGAVVVGALAAATILSIAPAQANSSQARCELSQGGGPAAANAACLYFYNDGSGAMYSHAGSVQSFSWADGNNPNNEEFDNAGSVDGGGAGAGEWVWNNATAVESEWDASVAVWYNSNYSGAEVVCGNGQGCTLYGTKLYNEDASMERV
jgi:hypothetical protein